MLITPIIPAKGWKPKKRSSESGIRISCSMVSPETDDSPSITWNCFAKIPTPIAASIPCNAEAGKNSLIAPKRSAPKRNNKPPERIMAANVKRYPR